MTYKEIITKLKSIDNFTLARYGDGEINAILGASNGQNNKVNCDGHHYFKDMGMRLLKIIKSQPDYVMGLQNLVQRLRKDDPDFHELIKGITWTDSDIIHRASIKNNNLDDLFQALAERNIVMVGNVDMVEISFKFQTEYTSLQHLVISEKDCWLEYDDVLKRLREVVNKDAVVLYCASMMAEVLIDDLYNIYGDDITQIDIGSAFDPYIGKVTRSYHKNIKR